MKILTNKQLQKLKDEYINEAFNCYWNHFEQSGIISELERLKQDHWDKNAFDRIVNALKSIKNNHKNENM